MDNKISVLILTQNSGKTLERTLNSVKDFDEIVVIDGGSTDNSKELALKFNANFVHHPFHGFSEQRNFALTQASHSWCLFVDSDEAVTKELKEELYRQINLDKVYPLYRIIRTEYLNGVEIKSGPSSRSIQERFFQKALIQYQGQLHEFPVINGVKPSLHSDQVFKVDEKFRLLHNPATTIEEYVDKLAYYSKLKAKDRSLAGKSTSLFMVWFVFNGTFFKTLWKNRKEGKNGFMMAVIEGCHKCLIHLMVYQKQNYSESETGAGTPL